MEGFIVGAIIGIFLFIKLMGEIFGTGRTYPGWVAGLTLLVAFVGGVIGYKIQIKLKKDK